MIFSPEQLDVCIMSGHLVSRQMTFVDTLEKETDSPSPSIQKVRQEVWTDSTTGKANKHVANTNPVIRDTGGIPWWVSGYKLALLLQWPGFNSW